MRGKNNKALKALILLPCIVLSACDKETMISYENNDFFSGVVGASINKEFGEKDEIFFNYYFYYTGPFTVCETDKSADDIKVWPVCTYVTVYESDNPTGPYYGIGNVDDYKDPKLGDIIYENNWFDFLTSEIGNRKSATKSYKVDRSKFKGSQGRLAVETIFYMSNPATTSGGHKYEVYDSSSFVVIYKKSFNKIKFEKYHYNGPIIFTIQDR